MSSPAWDRRRRNVRARRRAVAVLSWVDSTGATFAPWQRALLVDLLVSRDDAAAWAAVPPRVRHRAYLRLRRTS